eukprot:scaffold72704_cov16-Prasinocladus_malaysianus.AAC.1
MTRVAHMHDLPQLAFAIRKNATHSLPRTAPKHSCRALIRMGSEFLDCNDNAFILTPHQQ